MGGKELKRDIGWGILIGIVFLFLALMSPDGLSQEMMYILGGGTFILSIAIYLISVRRI